MTIRPESILSTSPYGGGLQNSYFMTSALLPITHSLLEQFIQFYITKLISNACRRHYHNEFKTSRLSYQFMNKKSLLLTVEDSIVH